MNRRTRLVWLMVVGCLAAAAVAAAILAAVPFATVRGSLDARAGDASADVYTPELHRRLRIAFAGCALVAGALAAVAIARRAWLTAAIDRGWRRGAADLVWLCRRWRMLSRGLGVALVAVTVLGGIMRAMYLDQPMRYDEAHTYLFYASQPWFVAISKYDAPNNHVFHSLLVLVSTRVFSDAPWAIRLPAFVAGVLVVPASMLLARRVAGAGAAVIAGCLVAVSSALIEYSTNARGYTLVTLMTLTAWLAAVELSRRPNVAAAFVFAASVVIGCWTVPTMLYPTAMIAAWLLLRRGAPRRMVLVSLAAAVAGVLLVYAPVLAVQGPAGLTASGVATETPWPVWIAQAPDRLADAGALLLRDIPLPLVIIGGVSAIAGVIRGGAPSKRCLWPLTMACVASLALLAVQRVWPPTRVWLFLIPLAAIVVGAGVERLLRGVPSRRSRWIALGVAAATFSIWPLVNLARNDSIHRSAETGTLPEAEQVIADLRRWVRPGELILTVSPSSAQLVYYARQSDLDLRHFDRPAAHAALRPSALIVVHRRERQTIASVLQELDMEHAIGPYESMLLKEYASARVYRIMP